MVSNLNEVNWVTVPTRIVDAATILGFRLFGESTIQTESTIQWVYYYFNFYIASEKMYIFAQKNTLLKQNKVKMVPKQITRLL